MPAERGIAQYRVIQTPEFALEFLARMSGPDAVDGSSNRHVGAMDVGAAKAPTTKQTPQDGADPIDQAGHALVAMLHQAAHSSNENMERAVSMAHKLSIQLRAAEDRIAQLQGEVERVQNRPNRAEQWLEKIKQAIEVNLIASMEANRPELPAVH